MEKIFEKIYNKNRSVTEEVAKGLFNEDYYKIGNLINYFKDTDFYYSPASRSYHDNYPGGLFDHSVRVYNELLHLNSKMKFDWSYKDLFIVGMCHDLCKVGSYIYSVDENGVISYKYSDSIPKGHGTESLSRLANLIPDLITEEIATSIVCHMGLYTNDIDNFPNFMLESQRKNELVFFTHCADMIASRCGISGESKIVDGELSVTYKV